MRKIALVLVLVGGVFIWTGCPEQPGTGTKPPTTGGDTSAPVGSK